MSIDKAVHALTSDLTPTKTLATQAVSDLSRLLEEVRKANGDRSLISDVLASTHGNGSGGEAHHIAALMLSDPDEYEAWMARLRGSPGASSIVKKWEAVIRRKALGLHALTGDEGHPAPDGVPDGWDIPDGWDMSNAGIFRGTGMTAEQISTEPMWVIGHLVDVDDNSCLVDVAWPGWVDELVNEIVPREVIADAHKLLGLAARGAPVHSANARDLVRFLDAAQKANQGRVPVVRVARRCGWFRDGFMVGEEWVTEEEDEATPAPPRKGKRKKAEQADPEAVEARRKAKAAAELVLHASEGEQQLAHGLRARGTWDGWVQICEEIAELPMVWLAIYGAVGSILLEPLKIEEGAVLDWSGETSQGKTTALRVAASVWGRPTEGGFIRTWKDTLARIEGEASFFFHLPLLLDDTKHLEKEKDGGRKARDVIYSHTSGEGKGRGMQDGGIRATRSWRSWLLSCGEQRITSFSQDQGSRGRSLCFEGSPFQSRQQAEDVTERVLAHHGHLGRRVLRELQRPYGADLFRQVYSSALDQAQQELADAGAVAGRLAKVVAVLETAKQLCEQAGLPAPKCKPIEVALAAARASSADSDRPAAALAYLYEVAASSPTRFFGRHVRDPRDQESAVPSGGWFGRWDKDQDLARWEYMAWVPFQVRRLLEDGGYDVDGTIERWAERGWLVEADGRHRMRRVRIDGVPTRCLCIARKPIEELC